LFSCKTGQVAFETDKLGKGHGVFFHHVIQALKGKAMDTKGRVTWSRLVEHVADKVAADVPALIGGGASQTPHLIANIAGSSPVLVSGLKGKGTAKKGKKTAEKAPPAKEKAKDETTNSLGIRFKLIPAGEF